MLFLIDPKNPTKQKKCPELCLWLCLTKCPEDFQYPLYGIDI
jgi:hypothetical protein